MEMNKSVISLAFVMVMISLVNGIRVGTHKEMNRIPQTMEAEITFTTFGTPVAVLVNGKEIGMTELIETYPIDPRFETEPLEMPTTHPDHDYDESFGYKPQVEVPENATYPYVDQTEYSDGPDYEEDDEEIQHEKPYETVLLQENAVFVDANEEEEEYFEVPIYKATTEVKYGDLISIVFQNNPDKQRGLIGEIELIHEKTKMIQKILTGESWKCNYYSPILTSNMGEASQAIPIYSENTFWIDIPIYSEGNIVCTTMV